MKLTEEQKKKVLDMYKSNYKDGRGCCPGCRAESYLIVDEVVRCFVAYEPNPSDYTTKPTPVVLLTCNACGYVISIALPDKL